MKKILFILIVILAFFISCFKNIKNEKDSNAEVHDWVILKQGNITIEKLYKGNFKLLETNYYTNDKLDSFVIRDIKNFTALKQRLTSKNSIDSVTSFYYKGFYNSDTFRLTLWLPVERNKEYDYKIFKDSIQILEFHLKDNPLVEFKYPYSDISDTTLHQYYIIKTTKCRNINIKTGPFKMFNEKNRTIYWVE